MDHPLETNLRSHSLVQQILSLKEPWGVDDVRWNRLINDLEPFLRDLSFDLYVDLPQHSQAVLLNMAFMHPRLFDLIGPTVAPLWDTPTNASRFMTCVETIAFNHYQNCYGKPFVFQEQALNIEAVRNLLDCVPNLMQAFFLNTEEEDQYIQSLPLWLAHDLCTPFDVLYGAIRVKDFDLIKNLQVAPEVWVDCLRHQRDEYFIDAALDILPDQSKTPELYWDIAQNTPAYDRYDWGFGEWNRSFCQKIFAGVEWNARKINILMKQVFRADSFDMEHCVELLHQILPGDARPLLAPYVLNFSYSRSPQMQNFTNDMRNAQQRQVLLNHIPDAPERRGRKK